MDSDPDPDRFREDDGPPRWSARWWFARFAFSFLVLAAVAGYEGYRAHQRGYTGRATLLFVAAVAGIGIGFTAIRMRHRP
jgi:hypothetical protein